MSRSKPITESVKCDVTFYKPCPQLLKDTTVYADFTQPPFWNRKRGSGRKKPGSIAFNHRSSGHIVVFQAVHPSNEKSVIKSCHFIAFRLLLVYIFFISFLFFNKTARGIRHPSSAHFSTSTILNRGSSSRLVVQVIVVYLYFRVSSHRSLAFDFKMAAAWNRRISRDSALSAPHKIRHTYLYARAFKNSIQVRNIILWCGETMMSLCRQKPGSELAF